MAVANATKAQLQAAYAACQKVTLALQDRVQGNASPFKGTQGRVSDTDAQTLVAAATTALGAVTSASGTPSA